MAIYRENILSLIGNRRYHSAILTTFSFDFFFFEMKAMKWLRSCGVRNVNVFVDGHYYAELMHQTIGEEMRLTPGYSLYPVFQKSLFHPKIWMLFGEKEGLLIVGSGNLTNSGNGENEEIWGAFHFDIRITENAALFADAWSYLTKLSLISKGLIREKSTRWIVDQARWLNELPVIKPLQFHSVSGKEKVAFLSNKEDSTIWQQLTTLIGNEKIVEITSLAPFYDVNGQAIQSLNKLFPNAKVNVIVDTTGCIPTNLPISKNYLFFDWYNLGISKSLYSKAQDGSTNSRLHAKILHFKTSAGKEYCLFGSANMTPEGLGIPGKIANNEVSLLIESFEGGLLNRLGIKLKVPHRLSEFNTEMKPNIYDQVIKNNRSKLKLVAVEWLYDELHLFIEGHHNEQMVLKLFDREGKIIENIKIDQCKSETDVKTSSSIDIVHHGELYDVKTNLSISNKILLTDYNLLVRTHPNPRTGDFEELYNQLHGGDLTKVFDLIQYAIMDNTESDSIVGVMPKRNPSAEKSIEKESTQKQYDLSSYKPQEYNHVEKQLLLSSLSLRILDVLKFTKSSEFAGTTEAELQVDEQEADLSSISGVDEKEVEGQRNIPLSTLKSDKRKLCNYFDELYDHYQFLIYGKQKPKDYRPSLTDLARYLIALELLIEFGGKTQKHVENKKEEFFSYLELNGEEPYLNDNVKSCCLNIIGVFLMLSRYGFKQYDFDYTRKKIDQLKWEALSSTIVVLLNLRWKEEELRYLKSLLLNCLHYLGDKTPTGFSSIWATLKKDIAIKASSLKHQSSLLKENTEWFERKAVPAFYQTITQLEKKQFETQASKGQIIYKSPWGYCYVKEVSKHNDFTLIRPGFLWDENIGDYSMHSDDEVFRPLRLGSFISSTV